MTQRNIRNLRINNVTLLNKILHEKNSHLHKKNQKNSQTDDHIRYFNNIQK